MRISSRSERLSIWKVSAGAIAGGLAVSARHGGHPPLCQTAVRCRRPPFRAAGRPHGRPADGRGSRAGFDSHASLAASGDELYTLAPCRVIDTRGPVGPYGGPPLVSGTDRTFVFGGRCGIPMTAVAVPLNVVAVNPTNGPGFFTLYPGGTPRPLAATMNYNAGGIRANNAIIPLGTLKDIAVRCQQGPGTANMVVDVNGYFAP